MPAGGLQRENSESELSNSLLLSSQQKLFFVLEINRRAFITAWTLYVGIDAVEKRDCANQSDSMWIIEGQRCQEQHEQLLINTGLVK